MKIINIVSAIVSMKKKIIICVGLCLMSGLITVSAQIKLSLNPDMGKKYEYRIDVVQNIKQNVMGQDVPVETKMNSNYLMEIKNKTPQEIHVQFTYSDFTFLVSSAMMNSSYDSKKPTENPSEMDKMLGKLFSALIDKPFVVVFAPDGSVKSVTGMEAVIKDMRDAVSDDGQLGAQIGAQMSQQFNDEAMKATFGQTFNFYPDKTVKIGDSWNVKNSILMSGMNLNINSNNTLKEIKTNMATIEVAGDIDMNMEGGEITGKQTGSMIIDAATGMPTTSDISQNMSGSIKVQGMDVKMEMITKTKTSVKVKN
jgi:hypothetical protein